jgi:hypothetical protein
MTANGPLAAKGRNDPRGRSGRRTLTGSLKQLTESDAAAFAGTCRICGVDLPAGAEAIYERSSKTVRCVSHDVVAPVAPAAFNVVDTEDPEIIDSGTAGASARREFERRKAGRDQRIRAKHPRLGGLMLAVTDQPRSTTAWGVGAIGEERLGQGLDRIACDTVRVLHDRRIPRSRANIDHLAVTAGGVYVIDAKRYRGRPHLKIDGGLFRPRVERLLVGSRDCTTLVDGMLKQIEVVRQRLEGGVPVHGALCFVDADWPVFGGTFTTRGVQALWPKKLYAKLQAEGPLTEQLVSEIHRQLALALPMA